MCTTETALSRKTPDDRAVSVVHTIVTLLLKSVTNENKMTLLSCISIAALKFCFKTCVAMKFVDDNDDDDDRSIARYRVSDLRFG